MDRVPIKYRKYSKLLKVLVEKAENKTSLWQPLPTRNDNITHLKYDRSM
jgi:hypothetical protein